MKVPTVPLEDLKKPSSSCESDKRHDPTVARPIIGPRVDDPGAAHPERRRRLGTADGSRPSFDEYLGLGGAAGTIAAAQNATNVGPPHYLGRPSIRCPDDHLHALGISLGLEPLPDRGVST